MLIQETFQNTIQGEGFYAGARADFIRTFGCPVGCYFCDTGYFDGGKGLDKKARSIKEILSEIISNRVIITGGEPMIQKDLRDLTDQLLSMGKKVSIETPGAYYQELNPEVWITLSPKQHISPNFPVVPDIWGRANEFKFVIDQEKDIDLYLLESRRYKDIKPQYLNPNYFNMKNAVEDIYGIMKKYDYFKMGIQMHKFYNFE